MSTEISISYNGIIRQWKIVASERTSFMTIWKITSELEICQYLFNRNSASFENKYILIRTMPMITLLVSDLQKDLIPPLIELQHTYMKIFMA